MLKSLVTWTDLFNAMANSNGLTHVNIKRWRECFHLSMPSQSKFSAEHMVCWTSVQYPHRLCVTGLLQLPKCTVPVCVVLNTFICVQCVVHIAMHVLSFCCLRLCYVQSCTIDDSHVHATAPCCSCAVTQACPTMSCICLVKVQYTMYTL